MKSYSSSPPPNPILPPPVAPDLELVVTHALVEQDRHRDADGLEHVGPRRLRVLVDVECTSDEQWHAWQAAVGKRYQLAVQERAR